MVHVQSSDDVNEENDADNEMVPFFDQLLD